METHQVEYLERHPFDLAVVAEIVGSKCRRERGLQWE